MLAHDTLDLSTTIRPNIRYNDETVERWNGRGGRFGNPSEPSENLDPNRHYKEGRLSGQTSESIESEPS